MEGKEKRVISMDDRVICDPRLPIGALIPPEGFHGNIGIIGNEKFLKKLRDAIDEALEIGASVKESIFTSDGEDKTLVVKVEENDDKIPCVYYGYESEWNNAYKILDKAEKRIKLWEKLKSNFSNIFLYLMGKMIENKSDSNFLNYIHKKWNELNRTLFYDKNHIRIPNVNELKEAFKSLNLPESCVTCMFKCSEL